MIHVRRCGSVLGTSPIPAPLCAPRCSRHAAAQVRQDVSQDAERSYEGARSEGKRRLLVVSSASSW
eukprot:scaffold177516_cov26-Tisochrysis_lutea.AAC.2